MKYRTRVSSKGQVVIPKEIREKYGFREGTEVVIKPVSETAIVLERAPRLSELFGFMGRARAAEALLREREAEAAAEWQRWREAKRRWGSQ